MSSSSRIKPGGRQTRVPGSGRSEKPVRHGRPDKAGMSGTSGRTSGGAGFAREVDLHLPSGHTGPEALERQLARVRGELNSAIRAGEKEIIFIHGSGTGRLREALRDVVASEYPSCSCHDASFIRYGYIGATTVTIRK